MYTKLYSYIQCVGSYLGYSQRRYRLTWPSDLYVKNKILFLYSPFLLVRLNTFFIYFLNTLAIYSFFEKFLLKDFGIINHFFFWKWFFFLATCKYSLNFNDINLSGPKSAAGIFSLCFTCLWILFMTTASTILSVCWIYFSFVFFPLSCDLWKASMREKNSLKMPLVYWTINSCPRQASVL